MSDSAVPDPSKAGAGQETPPGPSVEERLAQLEAATRAADKRATDAEQARDKAENEKRLLQGDRDRKGEELRRLQQTRATAPNAPLEDLRSFANQQAKEALLYRRLAETGLKASDLRTTDFETPAELEMAIQIAGIEKAQADQNRRLEESEERRKTAEAEAEKARKEAAELNREETSTTRQDTGGPTRRASGKAASEQQRQQINAARARAQELVKMDDPESLREARYIILDIAHKDPDKIIPGREEE